MTPPGSLRCTGEGLDAIQASNGDGSGRVLEWQESTFPTMSSHSPLCNWGVTPNPKWAPTRFETGRGGGGLARIWNRLQRGRHKFHTWTKRRGKPHLPRLVSTRRFACGTHNASPPCRPPLRRRPRRPRASGLARRFGSGCWRHAWPSPPWSPPSGKHWRSTTASVPPPSPLVWCVVLLRWRKGGKGRNFPHL